MPSTRLARYCLILSACLGPTEAAQAASVLGADGQIFEASTGTIQVTVAGAAETHVALQQAVTSHGTRTTVVVPGTDGPEVEFDPFVFQATEPGAVFVIWLSRAAVHNVIHLRYYRDGLWGEDVALCSDEFSDKAQLTAVLSRDALQSMDAAASRQVLHLFWQETGGQGTLLQHAPLLFVDGVYRGSGRIRSLPELADIDREPPAQASA